MPELNGKGFIREIKKEFKDFESNWIEGQYSPFEIDEDAIKDCIDFVSNQLILLVKWAWKEKWCK